MGTGCPESKLVGQMQHKRLVFVFRKKQPDTNTIQRSVFVISLVSDCVLPGPVSQQFSGSVNYAELQRFLSHFMILRCGTVCIRSGVGKEKKTKNISLCGHAHRATKLTCPSRLVPLAVDSNTRVGDSVDWWVYALAPNAVLP